LDIFSLDACFKYSPLGLLKIGPYGDELANFRRYRSVEVKHGRIAMLATLGTLVQENYHFQGYISPSQGIKFEDIPNGLGALSVTPIEGLVQITVLIGLHEVFIKEREGKAPGDFGTGKICT
jgi:light-harvesting complex I chlorophyll a/b binding protein 1